MDKYKVSDIFNLQMGKTPARNKPKYWNNGDNRWVSIADMSTYNKYVGSTKETISNEGVKTSGIKIIPSDTVIVSFKLSLGKVAITTQPIYTNEAIMAFIDRHIIDILPDYIYHLFSWMDWAAGTNKAVKGVTLNKTTIESYEIKIPPLPTQHKIAYMLDYVKALIEKRKAQIQKLDLLVKSQFLGIFGDPVTNPMGWGETIVENVCEKIVDCPHSTPNHFDEPSPYPSIRTCELKDGYIDWTTMKYVNEVDYQERTKRIKPLPEDIIYGREGSFGEAVLLPYGYHFCLGQRVMLLRAKTDICVPEFLWYSMRSDYIYSQAKERNIGATVGHVNVADIKKFKFLLPPLKLQNRFADFVRQVDKSKFAMNRELEKLQLLYKSLMQKCFSGEMF